MQEEVDKYQTRGEFWKFSPNAAKSALSRGLMDELFKNHSNKGISKKYKKLKSFENFKN